MVPASLRRWSPQPCAGGFSCWKEVGCELQVQERVSTVPNCWKEGRSQGPASIVCETPTQGSLTSRGAAAPHPPGLWLGHLLPLGWRSCWQPWVGGHSLQDARHAGGGGGDVGGRNPGHGSLLAFLGMCVCLCVVGLT